MLTKLTIRNFKQFDEVEIPLPNGVVFVGPNNSGKTSALQALALWHAGLRTWRGNEKILETLVVDMSEQDLLDWDNILNELAEDAPSKSSPQKKRRRWGAVMHRNELTSMPLPRTDLFWRGRKTRQNTQPVRVDIIVEGENAGKKWECGLEFDTSGGDSFYCRPMRLSEGKNPSRMSVPYLAHATKVAMLPPMSGLHLEEERLEDKRVNALIGEGRTAQVLRNLCARVAEAENKGWEKLTKRMRTLFGASLLPPFTNARGVFVMEYTERGGKIQFDLQSSGRGMQQVMLLLAFLQMNPGSALLLDEPDAHLEILRQREIYRTLLEAAEEQSSQIIIASHSEVLLNEAADRDAVVAFVGKPHLLSAKGKNSEKLKRVNKALSGIGHDQYYLAEMKGWVLYVEDMSDLAILRAFAEKIKHGALKYLQEPFCHYIDGSDPAIKLADHFAVLREAKPDLVAMLVVDSDKKLSNRDDQSVTEMKWKRREIENYICSPRSLIAFAGSNALSNVWGHVKPEDRCVAMKQEIEKLEAACETTDLPPPFSHEVKASDETLKWLFNNFAKAINVQPPLRKSNFYKIIPFIPDNEIDPEIRETLDAIHTVAKKAKPRTN